MVFIYFNITCNKILHPQDVFLMIRRHKTTIFTDAKESMTVYELKRIVEGILKRPPEDQRLFKVSWFSFPFLFRPVCFVFLFFSPNEFGKAFRMGRL